ncbi:MAG: hypothetical protein JSV89_18695 [Spirochaetaceae bacterium]|nr:MAG: hypothetical protein JSV89_18695 [Spirochaetaceae bacterium]
MVRKTTVLTLLLICLSLVSLTRADAAGRPTLGLGIQSGVAIADNPVGLSYDFFTPKIQAVGALNALLDIPLFSSFSLGLAFQMHGATISNYAGGWVYKSHWGGAVRLSAGYGVQLRDPSQALQLKLGAAAGASFNFDLYTLTTLFFYYPGIFLEPYIELNSSKRKNSSLAFVLPIDYYFRRDLELYLSIGIGALWRYTLQ